VLAERRSAGVRDNGAQEVGVCTSVRDTPYSEGSDSDGYLPRSSSAGPIGDDARELGRYVKVLQDVDRVR
jgi:hypothetical protein